MNDDEKELNRQMLSSSDDNMQKTLFYEEMGEVLTAMSHYSRGRCDLSEVLGEFADLQIMLNRMIILYSPNGHYYDDIYAEKLQHVRDLLVGRRTK